MFGARNFLGLYITYGIAAIVTVAGIYIAVTRDLKIGLVIAGLGLLTFIIAYFFNRRGQSNSEILASGGGSTSIDTNNMPRGQNYIPADVYKAWEMVREDARANILADYDFPTTPPPPKYKEGFDPTPYVTSAKDAKMGGQATANELARIRAILDQNTNPAYLDWVRSFEGGGEQDRRLAEWDIEFAIQNYPFTKPYISNPNLPIKVWNQQPGVVTRLSSFFFG